MFIQTGVPLAGTRDVGIDNFRITAYGTGSSTGGSKEIFFNNLMIIGLAGDYNRDGQVDAADYVVWRKTDGTMAGYNAWRTHFGQTAGSGSSTVANAAVPEPSTLVMLVLAAAGVCSRRSRATWKVPSTHQSVTRVNNSRS